MRVALVNNYLPFIYGGGEFLVDTLRAKLLEHGHEVTVTRIPFPATLDHKVLTNILSCRCLSFDDADKVVAFKFPAYFVRHPNKTLWLFHQLRQVYELWDSEYGLRDSGPASGLRDVVHRSDGLFLREAKKVYAVSHEVAGRLKRYNDIDATVLYPPLMDQERFRCEEYGDFLFYPSRVTYFKRQHLAVESMRYTRSPVRLVLAGTSDEPEYDRSLRQLIEKHSLADKVTILGWIDQEQKFSLMARALASMYLAFQEDSYGFVSMEAFYSKKCVVALDDSGGTKELIVDGVNGFVVPPDPAALAEKFDALYDDRALARSLGENGYAELTSRDLTWDGVVTALTE
jgi:glycosyltransferase involved in cell wall biosynthesis